MTRKQKRRPELAYRVQNAVEVSGLSKSRLYELMAAGELEFYHVGRSRLIPADALEQFLEKQRRASASNQPQPAA